MCECTEFFALIPDFTETPESRSLWSIYKHSQPEHIMTICDKLNIFQQRWIVANTSLDAKDNARTISAVFDAAKPWLNTELYAKCEEEKDNTRDNILYDETNPEVMDERLRARAKAVVAEKVAKAKAEKTTKVSEDLDTIVFGDD